MPGSRLLNKSGRLLSSDRGAMVSNVVVGVVVVVVTVVVVKVVVVRVFGFSSKGLYIFTLELLVITMGLLLICLGNSVGMPAKGS